MKPLTYLLFAILIGSGGIFSKRLKGTYNSQTQTFEAKDKSYWIGWFKDGIAHLSKDGYLGLVDSTGKILCKPQYDKIYPFYHNRAIVCLNRQYGIINRKGKEILSPSLPYIADFSTELAWFYNDTTQLWGLLNTEGEIIRSAGCLVIDKFNDTRLYWADTINEIISDSGEKIYVLNSHSVAEAQGERQDIWTNYYDLVRRGRIQVYYNDIRNNIEVGKPNKKLIIRPDILFHFNEGLASVPINIDGHLKIGYINAEGKVVIPAEYDNAHYFINGLACVKKEGKWGVINKVGKLIIPFNNEYLENTPSGHLIFMKNGLLGIMDKDETIHIPAEHLRITHLFDSSFALLQNRPDLKRKIEGHEEYGYNSSPFVQAWGAINLSTHDTLLPFQFDHIEILKDDIAIGLNYLFNDVKFPENEDPTDVESMIFRQEQLSMSQPPPRHYTGKVLSKVFNAKGLLHSDSYHSPSKPFLGIHQADFGDVAQLVPYLEIDDCYNFSGIYVNQDGMEIKDTTALQFLKQKEYRKRLIVFTEMDSLTKNEKSSDEPIIAMGTLLEKPLPWTQNKGIKTMNGDTLFSPNYNHLNIVSAGIIVGAIIGKERKYGYFDLTGKELIPIIYQHIEETPSGRLAATLNHETFPIDKSGKRID